MYQTHKGRAAKRFCRLHIQFPHRIQPKLMDIKPVYHIDIGLPAKTPKHVDDETDCEHEPN